MSRSPLTETRYAELQAEELNAPDTQPGVHPEKPRKGHASQKEAAQRVAGLVRARVDAGNRRHLDNRDAKSRSEQSDGHPPHVRKATPVSNP